MDKSYESAVTAAQHTMDRAAEVLNRLLDLAGPSGVFGEPVTKGDYTVITASEVAMGMGLGSTVGVGSAPGASKGDQAYSDPDRPEAPTGGAGGGGGGGGGKGSRPVAAIIIGPEGVRVEPIVDPTKLGIAFFTTLGTMFLMFSRMRRRR